VRDPRDGGRPGLIAAAAAIALVFLVHAWWLCAVVDDAFITFRYARHLAHGQGWVYNLGDPPVEGFTSVLWVLTSALASSLGFDVVVAAQALGLAAALATMAYAYRTARDRLGLSPTVSLVPCAVLAQSVDKAAKISAAATIDAHEAAQAQHTAPTRRRYVAPPAAAFRPRWVRERELLGRVLAALLQPPRLRLSRPRPVRPRFERRT